MEKNNCIWQEKIEKMSNYIATYDERENLRNGIVDSFAVEQTVYLVALSDSDFILFILGQNRETLG